MFFGLDQSQANRWRKTLRQVLREALNRGGYLPVREAQPLEEEFAKLPPSDLILDGTERRRQQPKDQEAQKLFYGGKIKSTHVQKPGDS